MSSPGPQRIRIGPATFEVPGEWVMNARKYENRRSFRIGELDDPLRAHVWIGHDVISDSTARGRADMEMRFLRECWIRTDGTDFSEPETYTRVVDGKRITTVEIRGGQLPVKTKPDLVIREEASIRSFLDSPGGSLDIKIEGPAQTVDRWRSAFDRLVDDIEIDDDWRQPRPEAAKNVSAGDRIDVGGVTIVVPKGWILLAPYPIDSVNRPSLRVAELCLPGVEGSDDATLSFGPAVHLTPGKIRCQPNILKNREDFRQPDGSPAEGAADERVVSGVKIQTLSVAGTYIDSSTAPDGIPDRGLIISLLESPTHRLLVRLKGSRQSIEHWQASYFEMLDSIELAD
ncbi:MAG: hypothetical protein RL885_24085 [Planctomycetota bacterium]